MGAMLIDEFDIWQAGYGGSSVKIYQGGTTTLATIYTDFALTTTTTNPQTLQSDASGNGKFTQSLYIGESYELEIDISEQSGVRQVPITTLAAADASDALVTTTDGTIARALDDREADWIKAIDHGNLAASSTENTTTLTTAIGVASAQNGGRVLLPSGTYEFTQISLPANVVLVGESAGATTIKSTFAGKVVTITGDKAGLSRLTLDGVSNVASGVGLYAKAISGIRLEDIIIKRFVTGAKFHGGDHFFWRNVTFDTITDAVQFHGDTDASGGGGGSTFTTLDWVDGKITAATGTGADLSVVDQACYGNTISGVQFASNVGDEALLITGAQNTRIVDCDFSGNTKNLTVADGSDTTVSRRKVYSLLIEGGEIASGELSFDGLCQEIEFNRTTFSSTDFTLTTPEKQILLKDCNEIGSQTFAGSDTTKIARFRSTDEGRIVGSTTGAGATTVWKRKMLSGEVLSIEVRANAVQLNDTDNAAYHVTGACECSGGSLDFDGQTVNFTLGDLITGGTSGATSYLLAQTDSGATGTLTLAMIQGTYEDDEAITSNSGGAAVVNGTLTEGTVGVKGATASLYSDEDTGAASWDVTLAGSGQEALVQVTGAASDTIQWSLDIRVTSQS